MREAILYYALKYKGDWTKIAKAIQKKEPWFYIECKDRFITIVDDAYPKAFRTLRYPPWILFYQGNYSLIQTECIGIIGARFCSKEALDNTEEIVKTIRDKYTIVSGLAKGIDGCAHRMAKHTIGIIGCGIERIYPKENEALFGYMREHQLILSEYPGYTAPLAKHFPWRNRLIAVLSRSLVVVEAKYHSGTMLTVNEALALSKPVYCLPTAYQNKEYPGCNYLISCGAQILLDAKELIYDNTF